MRAWRMEAKKRDLQSKEEKQRLREENNIHEWKRK